MPPQAGSRLGPYELVSPVGAGGMGEVWQGRDTRLDRSVAVKILPAALAQDEEFRARFEREAKTISSLNHPNICTLFDVGREGETQFLVMELLEGESLADRLERGPLKLDQVVKFGAQVADALDAAHKQGVVHRDLKPGNVTLTRTGAKLLDFGLARPVAGFTGRSASTELPTEAKPLTTAGTVLGTFQYMAPEQLEGTEADPRTDIFALGALLYEMATGRRAFEGKSKTSLIAAILSSQPPPISSVQAGVPPALDHVVRKCLEKDPGDRWQSAHDVASELRWIAEAGSQAGVPTTLTMRRRSRERLAWGLAAAFAAATVAGLGWASRLRGAARDAERPFRAELVTPPDLIPAPVVVGAMALSPDGRRLAFVTGSLAESRLAVRDLGSGETKPLAGTEGGTFPFWSPDGRWLAFFAEDRLKKVEAAGGPVQPICPAHAGRGGTWGPEGTIVFAPDITGALVRVPAGGGTPAPATHVPDPGVSHRNPWFLPDGQHFLFTARDTRSASHGSVVVGSLEGGEAKTLLPRGSNPQHADGFLFSVVDGNLLAQPFDAARLALTGQALPIADAIEYFNPRDLAHYSVQAGLVAFRRTQRRRTQLVWLDRAGKELAAVGEPSYHAGLNLGSDGHTLATVRSDSAGGGTDVWTLDLRRGVATRSTFVSGPSLMFAAVSPDGTRLAVSTSTIGGWAGSTIWLQPLSGSGSRQSLIERSSLNVAQWSADGAYLIGDTQEAESGFDVAYVVLKDPSKVVHVTTSRFDERLPALSGGGRLLAYQSNETGRFEVFLTDFPAGTRKWQVSRTGGEFPSWRNDGRELYFRDAGGVVAVDISERNGGIEVGPPQRLPFPREGLRVASGVRSPDGKRFLVLRFEGEAVVEPFRLLRSWRRVVEDHDRP